MNINQKLLDRVNALLKHERIFLEQDESNLRRIVWLLEGSALHPNLYGYAMKQCLRIMQELRANGIELDDQPGQAASIFVSDEELNLLFGGATWSHTKKVD